MLIDRRYLTHFDWLSFVLIILLSSIGLLTVYSATYQTSSYSPFFLKQLCGVLLSLGTYFILCCIDYRTTLRWSPIIYYGVLALLVITIIKGSIGMGAKRWINLFFFRFQPSELAKLFFPGYLIASLSLGTQKQRSYLLYLCILFISAFLIAKQPDLGTALIMLFSGLFVLWIAGMPTSYFLILFITSSCMAPLGWQLLKPYQKKRILVFIGHGNANDERYHLEQSRIAIGSGGIWGKGWCKGTQNTFRFLPERRTDFIFSVFCEEFGFMGAFIVLILFGTLFIRILTLAQSITHPYARLLIVGLMMPITLSMLINIGMVLGLLPIVGIPLPLMSYGTSHTIVTFAALGWINSIACRRFYFSLSSQHIL